MAENIDKGNPADDASVSAYPTNERASRTALENLIGTEHSATEGRHSFAVGNTAARDSITNWQIGSIFFNTITSPVTTQRVVSLGPVVWEDIGAPLVPEIEAGTIMCFFQAAAPTGWTQDVTQNDKVFRVVNTAGGGDAGSWTISGVTVDSHVLSTVEMPAHTHPSAAAVSGTQTVDTVGDPGDFPAKAGTATGSTGGGGGHVHGLTSDGAWRPAYIDVILAAKD